ncbi:MAG: dephospho-CoA kinase [Candidatus Acidiferrum sp.]
MLRIGLTGGIASGKSAVAAMLREMGFFVLDADALGHKLIEPGQPAHDEVLAEFGSSLAEGGGRIDRVKLAEIVFADRAKLARLNAIVHPRVEEALFRQFAEWERNGVRDAAFVEAALIVESSIHKKLDALVVAWCTSEQQLERLLARGMSETDAHRRIGSQFTLAEILRHATYSVDCSRSIDETRQQVMALASRLRRSATPPA